MSNIFFFSQQKIGTAIITVATRHRIGIAHRALVMAMHMHQLH
jgi:hypothetical protein